MSIKRVRRKPTQYSELARCGEHVIQIACGFCEEVECLGLCQFPGPEFYKRGWRYGVMDKTEIGPACPACADSDVFMVTPRTAILGKDIEESQ